MDLLDEALDDGGVLELFELLMCDLQEFLGLHTCRQDEHLPDGRLNLLVLVVEMNEYVLDGVVVEAV